MLTRTRSLNRRVECEQIRLLGNAADDFDAVADLLGALAECRDRRIHGLRSFLDLLHIADDLVDGTTALTHALYRIVRHICNHTHLLRHLFRMI